MEVPSLVLEPNQSKWQFPLYEARRKYTTAAHNLVQFDAGELNIEFDLADDVDPVSSEQKAQQSRLGPGNASQLGDLDELFDLYGPEATQPVYEEPGTCAEPAPDIVAPDDAPTPGDPADPGGRTN